MNEAELLLTDILKCDRPYLYLNKKKLLEKNTALVLSSVLKRRILGEPLGYILGKEYFMSLEFRVSPAVLIPRPETEILVETVLKNINLLSEGPSRILDLGTGSGCIAISLSKLIKGISIDATDISGEALEVARYNARLNRVEINFIHSDLFNHPQIQLHAYDIIVSNPPYIADEEFNDLPKEVTREPRIALGGGRDGLDFYRRIIAQAHLYLREKGLLIMEMGFNQKEAIIEIFERDGKFSVVQVVKDFNKIDRVIAGMARGD